MAKSPSGGLKVARRSASLRLSVSATGCTARLIAVKGQQRYSPGTIIGAKEYNNIGHSEAGQICTSHIERSNLTIRMQNRRFTHLTNALSKKWKNHERMFALFVPWYNSAGRT
jgi:hypothetical protein